MRAEELLDGTGTPQHQDGHQLGTSDVDSIPSV
jgi:hypothetical protein